MPSEELVYLSLTVVGVQGNTAVNLAFLLLLYQENQFLPADAIILHLACVNMPVAGVRCLLETLASFRMAIIFRYFRCKAVIFVYRTSRSLSVWLTFGLSAYQRLSVALSGSHWASIRTLAAHYLGFVFLFLWLLNTCTSSAETLFSFAT